MSTPHLPLCAAYFDPAFINFMSGLVCDEATALQLARIYGQNSGSDFVRDEVGVHVATVFFLPVSEMATDRKPCCGHFPGASS